MNLQEYIRSELLVLIPVLYVIGVGLRKSKIKNHFIPAILGVISVTLAAVYILATEPVTSPQEFCSALFAAVTQGVLAAGASVYFHQLYKQSKKKE